jgi:hypothetical protein
MSEPREGEPINKPLSGLPLDEAIYGLRNLAVADEDQARIVDYVDQIEDPVVRASVELLCANGQYGDAYVEAVRPTLEKMERVDLEKAVVLFVRDFVLPEDVKPSSYLELDIVTLVDNIMQEWERLLTKWWTPSIPRARPEGWENMEEVLDITGMLTFLQEAKDRGVANPKARFIGPHFRDIRLQLAGPRSLYPGGLEVRSVNIHIGTVLPNGFVIGALSKDKPILETLIAIAERPAYAAKTYGDLTGECSFCCLPFTDETSKRLGYSLWCGEKYGLPVE